MIVAVLSLLIATSLLLSLSCVCIRVMADTGAIGPGLRISLIPAFLPDSVIWHEAGECGYEDNSHNGSSLARDSSHKKTENNHRIKNKAWRMKRDGWKVAKRPQFPISADKIDTVKHLEQELLYRNKIKGVKVDKHEMVAKKLKCATCRVEKISQTYEHCDMCAWCMQAPYIHFQCCKVLICSMCSLQFCSKHRRMDAKKHGGRAWQDEKIPICGRCGHKKDSDDRRNGLQQTFQTDFIQSIKNYHQYHKDPKYIWGFPEAWERRWKDNKYMWGSDANWPATVEAIRG